MLKQQNKCIDQATHTHRHTYYIYIYIYVYKCIYVKYIVCVCVYVHRDIFVMYILRFLCQVTQCHKVFLSLKQVTDHMKLQQGHNYNLNFFCSIEESSYHYNTVEIFRKHERLNHAILWETHISSIVITVSSSPEAEDVNI